MENDWIKDKRTLRILTDTHSILFVEKKKQLLKLFEIACGNFISKMQLIIIDSHQAKINYDMEKNAIICDTHFIDVGQLVAASFYSNVVDTKRLANALMVDSFICSEDIFSALDHAHKYADGLYASILNMFDDKYFAKKIAYTRQYMSVYVFLHELAHEKYNSADFEFDSSIDKLEKLVKKQIFNQNKITKILNSIDITPIKTELDEMALNVEDYKNLSKQISFELSLKSLAKKNKELCLIKDANDDEKIKLLLLAFNNYIYKKFPKELDENKLTEECICDIIALSDLFDMGYYGASKIDGIKQAIDAYILSMLTQNMIQTSMEIQNIINNPNEQIDYVFMRLNIVNCLIFEIIIIYSERFNNYLSEDEMMDLASHFENVLFKASGVYSLFYENIEKIDFSKIDELYIPASSERYKKYYAEISSLMVYPV